ncbi:MAG: 16S rRNA (adenine(1518)-N(6)/adenine(1519)-N(6))-dimethyltransferase, partial [Lachnospiraceae bacterium]|nr:16S rRNA (adenine(1518)-N(6)/adenine(1519)-N(6))-dimethyltransferase [Lachnospiraceae bacterium]
MKLLEENIPVESITVMIQKEVAERMQAEPGGKEYGALSLAVQFYADTYIAANVPPNCFMPRPNVGSAVIRLTKHEKCPVKVQDTSFMFKVIRASFAQRRKTLVNGLCNSSEISVDKEAVLNALEEMGLKADVRGEKLSLAEFAKLSDLLCG